MTAETPASGASIAAPMAAEAAPSNGGDDECEPLPDAPGGRRSLMAGQWRVYVYTHPREGRKPLVLAYTRWFNGTFTGVCEHVVPASNGPEAKRVAIAEHRAKCLAVAAASEGRSPDASGASEALKAPPLARSRLEGHGPEQSTSPDRDGWLEDADYWRQIKLIVQHDAGLRRGREQAMRRIQTRADDLEEKLASIIAITKSVGIRWWENEDGAECAVNDRAEKVERSLYDALAALMSLYECNVWYGEIDAGDKARLLKAKEVLRAAGLGTVREPSRRDASA